MTDAQKAELMQRVAQQMINAVDQSKFVGLSERDIAAVLMCATGAVMGCFAKSSSDPHAALEFAVSVARGVIDESLLLE